MVQETNDSSAQRYYRHGEEFWRELIARQTQSSQGIRQFCQANGLATSTFHKWRAQLAERAEVASTKHLSVPDAMYIAVAQDPPPARTSELNQRRYRHRAALYATVLLSPVAACMWK